MNNLKTSIVWFRLDLRIEDNPALRAAATRSAEQVPVYIFDTENKDAWAPGRASRAWLHQSLKMLALELKKKGSDLVVLSGNPLTVLPALARETQADAVFWNRLYDPETIKRDLQISHTLARRGINVQTFNAGLLHEPDLLRTRDDRPFQVFTPFWNHFCSKVEPAPPVEKPDKLTFPEKRIDLQTLSALTLDSNKLNNFHSYSDFSAGEIAAQTRLKYFINNALRNYESWRNLPSEDGVSMLSSHLHFGEIGPRQVWQAVKELQIDPPERESINTFLKELGWREFAQYILFHFPETVDRPLRRQFQNFPWSDNQEALRLWQQGKTGYPIVDAGMRQLWQTGWMHNRVRMIVASFLTKDLLISWQKGARWFWETLVDADLASNTFNWQWAAGCGADAAPFFRIFNPVLQGEKFDEDGNYVKRWLPELDNLPPSWIHKPWAAPLSVLQSANVELGSNYPFPLVDHALAQKRAREILSCSRRQTLKLVGSEPEIIAGKSACNGAGVYFPADRL